jgi:hypothetical protein
MITMTIPTKKYTPIKCHEGTVEVFADPESDVVVCAGGTTRGVTYRPTDLIISLNETKISASLQMNFESELLAKYITKPNVLSIDWADFSVPSLKRPFWDDLVQEIRNQNRRTVVWCTGGHGRTGTCIAILGVLMGAYNASLYKDPVEWIRKVYCENVVETTSQICYIEAITGVKVLEKPSPHYAGATGGALALSDHYRSTGSTAFGAIDDEEDLNGGVDETPPWWLQDEEAEELEEEEDEDYYTIDLNADIESMTEIELTEYIKDLVCAITDAYEEVEVMIQEIDNGRADVTYEEALHTLEQDLEFMSEKLKETRAWKKEVYGGQKHDSIDAAVKGIFQCAHVDKTAGMCNSCGEDVGEA